MTAVYSLVLSRFFWIQVYALLPFPASLSKMARKIASCCVAAASAAFLLMALPTSFVPSPGRQGAVAAAAVAAGSAALPAWAYDPQMTECADLVGTHPGRKAHSGVGLGHPHG